MPRRHKIGKIGDVFKKNIATPVQQNVIDPAKKIVHKAALHDTRVEADKQLDTLDTSEADVKKASEAQESILTSLEYELGQIEIKRGAEGAKEKAVAKAELGQSPLFTEIDQALAKILKIEEEIKGLKEKAQAERDVISGASDIRHGSKTVGKDALTKIKQYTDEIVRKQSEVSKLREGINTNAVLIRAEIERIKKIGSSETEQEQTEGLSPTPEGEEIKFTVEKTTINSLTSRLTAATQALSSSSSSSSSDSEHSSSVYTPHQVAQKAPSTVVTLSSVSVESTNDETEPGLKKERRVSLNNGLV